MITAIQLSAIAKCADSLALRWVEPINATLAEYDISTRERMAAFLAQLVHESKGFKTVAENLNYSPEGLLATFNTPARIRFTRDQANQYGRTKDHPADQKMIANIAYADRMGNGGVQSGDGWYYRGRGPIQLTGKRNIIACGKAIGIDLQANPALLERPDVGAKSAGWFWTIGNPKGINLNTLADAGDIRGISRAINGGDNGMAERLQLTAEAMQILA